LGDTVCDLYRTRGGDEKRGFFSLASKLVVIVCQWFGLKTTTTVSWFGPQNQGQRFGGLASKPLLCFGDLDLKIIMTISWFGHQNQGEEVSQFAPQNQWADEDGVRTHVGIRQLTSVRSKPR
jgi:hypothetical protein